MTFVAWLSTRAYRHGPWHPKNHMVILAIWHCFSSQGLQGIYFQVDVLDATRRHGTVVGPEIMTLIRP